MGRGKNAGKKKKKKNFYPRKDFSFFFFFFFFFFPSPAGIELPSPFVDRETMLEKISYWSRRGLEAFAVCPKTLLSKKSQCAEFAKNPQKAIAFIQKRRLSNMMANFGFGK
jgi:hypothetical protein